MVRFLYGNSHLPDSTFTLQELALSELQENNQWDQVDDFKWLKATHSPNWSILPPEDSVANEVWRDIVPGPSWSLEDILRATRVTKA